MILTIFLFWIVSIIIAYGLMFLAIALAIYCLAQNSEIFIPDMEEEDDSKTNLIMFIPVVNVIVSLAALMSLSQRKFEITNMMHMEGKLDKMTDDEEEQFNENPTIRTSLKIMAKRLEKLEGDKNDNK